MNPEPDPTHPDVPVPDTSLPASCIPQVRSPRGKIARLPKTTRDKLNFMLRDGVSHPDVITQLGEEAKDITPRNVSNWHTSPSYQHWLLQQEWIEALREEQEPALDLLKDFDTARFNEAALQLAVTRLFLAFRHTDSGDLNGKLGGNARTFAGLVHALARACRETTNIEKYRAACASVIAAELKQLNMDRDLSDGEYELLINKMDQVFKVPRRPKSVSPKSEAGVPPLTKPATNGSP